MNIAEKEMTERMLQYWETGGPKVYHTGFRCMLGKYSLVLGSCTDWTGYPVSGKTEVMVEFLFNWAKFHGLKSLLYMPDAGHAEMVVGMLLQKYTGKQLAKTYIKDGQELEIRNRISGQELLLHLPSILRMFLIYDERQNGVMSPREYWRESLNMAVTNVVIDSWKDLKHEGGDGASTRYLAECLSERNMMVQGTDKHFHTVIHPNKATLSQDGSRPRATISDMKGGAEWDNSAKQALGVHRYAWTGEGSDIVDVFVDKAKDLGNYGRKGEEFQLKYHWMQRKYSEDCGAGHYQDARNYWDQ